MDELSDSRLIAQIQSGNIQAFATLYERYHHRVYRTALAITRDETAAEDILQECFLRVHSHIDKLHRENTLAPWLYRVTVNLSYQWLHKDRRPTPWLRTPSNNENCRKWWPRCWMHCALNTG